MPAPERLPLASLGEVVRRFGLAAERRLGQHFLFDPGILARIAAAAEPRAHSCVVEIGPGPGGLTRALLEAGAGEVVAIEADRRFLPALDEVAAAACGRLRIVEGDARRIRPQAVADGDRIAIVGNLPYNIGSELLVAWLSDLERIASLVVLLQKEVALRLVAEPGTADFGRLGVLAQTLCATRKLFDLPPAAFHPPPQVTSSLVRLDPLPERPAAAEVRALERVTRAAFGQRRKMLRSSLGALGRPAELLLAETGIDGRRRGETLSLAEFMALARCLLNDRG